MCVNVSERTTELDVSEKEKYLQYKWNIVLFPHSKLITLLNIVLKLRQILKKLRGEAEYFNFAETITMAFNLNSV